MKLTCSCQGQIPPIYPLEAKICRPFHSVLAQFLSGFSIHLRSFAHHIGLAPDSVCPRCGYDDEDVAHVFDCPVAPTTLSPIDRWLHPIDVAKFLARHPSLSDLPPLFLLLRRSLLLLRLSSLCLISTVSVGRSVRWSVRRSVRQSVTLCFFYIFGHFKGRKVCI